MKRLLRPYWFLTAAAVLLCASASFAQVTMTLTGVNGSTAGTSPTVYTNPYYGTINGVSATIICDDYADDSFFNETWQANAIAETTAGASVIQNVTPQVKWVDPQTGKNTAALTQQLYNEMSWLAIQMLAAAPGQPQEDYSFAIWQLACQSATSVTVGNFPCSPSPISTLGSADQAIVNQDIANAAGHANDVFSNVTIYTPVAGTGMCGSAPCPSTTPQEFIVVTPESSTIVMLGADLLGLLAFAYFFRRRLVLPVS